MPFLTRQPETSVLTKRAGRPRRPLVVVALLGALAALVFTSVALASTPVAVGFKDHAYAGGASRATGDKPQSKLWFAGGKWYAGLFTPTTANRYRIYRLDGTNMVSTGVDLDERDTSHADYLFDSAANKLYVVSAGQPVNGCTPTTSTTTSDDLRIYRYTFAAGVHTLDPGFPVVIDTCGSYTATIAKDSLGTLWVAYPQGPNVMINHSTINNATWGTPYRLPVQTVDIEPSFTMNDPDITAITAFGGTNIGVAWTNHDTAPAVTRFAVHADGGADDAAAWGTTAETALGASADDHLNMKTDPDGNVWIVTKTGLDNDPIKTRPLIQLLQRSAGGVWTTHLVSTVADLNTRPQLLISDTTPRVAYVLMTSPNGGGAIYYKSAPLTGPQALQFASGNATVAMPGTPFIKSAVETQVDDVTTTKQNVTVTTGVVGEASDRTKKVLLHNQFTIVAADGTAPVGTVAIAGGALTTPTATVSVDVPATDAGSGVSQVRLANTGGVNGSGVLNGAGAATFAYTTPVTWTLAAGDGAKTVFVQWRDGAGNWSTPISDTIDLDATGPTGNVEINGGDATTNIGSVSVDVTATDPNGVTNVRLSNTNSVDANGVLNGPDATTFAYSTPLAWTLTPENGTKTVYAQWQDGLGTWSALDSDSIDLDSPDTTFTPIPPSRLLDSRFNTPTGVTSFVHETPQSFQISGGVVPNDAVAVSANLTVVGQQRAGYVALGPSVAANPTTSTINFPTGDIRANGLIVPLANDGTLQAVYVAGGSGATGKTTDLILDVTGYFTETNEFAEYFSVTPGRFLDTRSNNPAGAAMLNPSVPFSFQVGGRTVGSAVIPADAVAVTGNLTVVGQTKAGFLSLTPESDANPGTSSLNFPVGDVRANNVTAPLGGDGKLWVVYKGSGKAHAIFDVTGYFLDDLAGMAFVPLTPTRTVDTRIDLGITDPVNGTNSKSFSVRGEAGVANDAEAFTANLTVVGQTKAGYVSITPQSVAPGATPATSTINFPTGDVRANGLAGPVDDASGEAWVTYRASPASATTQVVIDITGFFH